MKANLILIIGLFTLISAIVVTVRNADAIDGNSMLTEIIKANGGCR